MIIIIGIIIICWFCLLLLLNIIEFHGSRKEHKNTFDKSIALLENILLLTFSLINPLSTVLSTSILIQRDVDTFYPRILLLPGTSSVKYSQTDCRDLIN